MNPSRTQNEPATGGDLEQLLAVLQRRAGLIISCFVVTAAAAVGFSLMQEKEYSASASLLFRNPGFAEDLFGTSTATVNTDAVREAATNEKLVSLDVVSERTAKQLNGLSSETVSSMVDVEPEGQAELVSVVATSPEPPQARRVANEFARQFIAFRAETDRSKLLKAKLLAERQLGRLSDAERHGPRGAALSRAAEKLGILASLQTGNAELVQPADLPRSPSSPNPKRNGILGAVLGLLFGISLAFLLERLNRRLRDPEEAREAFGMPVLGTVPESEAIAASNEGTAPITELPFMENEAFRTMRASLRYFNVDQELRRLLVTSYTGNAGKSTVAWNLARVAASSAEVVVVEADMRNPGLAHQHGLNSVPGLAELLTGQVELDEAIQARCFSVGGNGTQTGERELDAITAGANPPNPAELIESKAMDRLLSRLGERYDLVVIDTPPTGVVSDAFPLLRKVDGVIAVARIGESTRDAARGLREQMERLDAPVLGLVANAIKLPRRRRYGYGYYGYGYGTGPAAKTSSETGPSDTPSV